jgi:toxin ParE1/3/4
MSSPEFQLELTRHARNDIETILSKTEETWGDRQADVYESLLHEALETIQENPHIGKARPDLKEGLFCFGVSRHFLFYTLNDQVIYVIRVLHDRMDYIRHLKDFNK